ncbi:MAG: mechanosensitive ion channel family protein [Patescibacteria group bacterium]
MPEINLATFWRLVEQINSFEIWGIDIGRFGITFALFLGLLLIFRVFRTVIFVRFSKLAKKTETDFDDLLAESLENIPTYFYRVLAAFIAFHFSQFTDPLTNKIINGVFVVFVVLQSIIFFQNFIGYALEKGLAKNEADAEKNQTAIHGVRIIASIALWTIGFLLILNNFGINITTLIASLGIGGIAIAFALQNILSDLFSSFAIYFDKPFKIGDYVMLGTDSGTIKKIGLKTTRITTLQGEELVVSNAELTSTRIKNFKRMKNRRISFPFGVVYGTSATKLRKIPEIVKKIIIKEKLADFDRCHFANFGDFSLNFTTVYHVKSREYDDYMDTQQSINLAIKEAFEKEKIEMAFPTQTVYLQK